MDPENYQDGSNVRKLVTRLRKEIRRAAQRATQTTHGTQTSSPTSTITAPSTGNNHLNTHNHTVSPATAKHKTPPPPLIDTFNSDPIPRATKNNVNHAPIINPHRVDGRQARDNNNTINEPHYEQEIRWAVTESLASLTREQNATPENDNNTRCPSSSTYGSASSSTIAPTPNLTNTCDNMTKPSAHTSNHSHTPFMTSSKMLWSQEDYNAYQWQEDTRGIAVQNTMYWASEGNTTLENCNNNLFPPSPPNEPAPTFTRTPAPPNR